MISNGDMKRVFVWAMVIISLSSCIGRGVATSKSEGVRLSEREEYRYNKAVADIEAVEAMMKECEQSRDKDAYIKLLTQSKALRYDYNAEGMNSATVEHCNQLRQRIENLQREALAFVEKSVTSIGMVDVYSHKNLLLTEKSTTPLYLEAGEVIIFEHKSSEATTLRLNNTDTRRTLRTYNSASVKDSIKIAYSGIYTIDLAPKTKCYSSLNVNVRPTSTDRIYSRKGVRSETVKCKKGDWGAKAVTAIEMHNCFEEPRKFTLRGQLKAMFSGNAKAVVAVQVPTGATDILYSLRVATSEQGRATDGKFHNNLTHSYKKIKMLGLPLYEKEKTRGVFMRLLDDNRPIRDEDAYCNMYVFRNANMAKQFQDGAKPASQLNYDVDFSTIGTQSCSGRIPTKGAKTIYLGFENERMRYVNYLWVEVVAVTPTTEYYTTKYSVQ